MEQSQAPEEHIRQYPKSILDRGYGMVGKYVMQDRDLHVIAKAHFPAGIKSATTCRSTRTPMRNI